MKRLPIIVLSTGVIVLAALAAVLVLELVAPPPARADLPGGAGCPAAAVGGGTAVHKVSAEKPAGAAANGVCINFIGTGGTNDDALLISNPAGCPLPTVGAGSSFVWADWGANNCVDPTEVVEIEFTSLGGVVINAVTWSLAGGGTQDGTADGSVSELGPVGGIAEFPDDEVSPLSASDTSGGSSFPLTTVAGGLAAVVLLAAGGVYARRRYVRS